MTRSPPGYARTLSTLAVVLVLAVLAASGARAALIDSTADGPFASGGSNEQDYYSLVSAMWTYTDSWGNATIITIPCDFGTCAWNGKSGSSNNNSDFNGANGKTKAVYANKTNFLVTDEFSQVALVTSMGDNGTRMAYVLNTVRAINGTNNGAGRGTLPLWCASIDNYVLNLTCTTDTASDGDARIIDSLFTCSGNTNFNSSLRDDCYNQAKVMAADFHAKDMLGVTKTYAGDGSQNITRWVCGGANVCSAITNSGFMYAGCEQHQYRVVEEHHLGERKRVDLLAERGKERFLIEVETGKSDVMANIKKCEGHAPLIMFFTNKAAFTAAAQAGIPKHVVVLMPENIHRIHEILN